MGDARKISSLLPGIPSSLTHTYTPMPTEHTHTHTADLFSRGTVSRWSEFTENLLAYLHCFLIMGQLVLLHALHCRLVL